jgi:hypothetical protein
MFQLEDYLTDMNEIWYRYCAAGVYLQISILTSVVTKRQMRKIVKWVSHEVVHSGGRSQNHVPTKTVAGVIHIVTVITMVNSVTICAVVMWVCTDISKESWDKFEYVTVVQ